jgi:hypothetical protein
MGMTRNASARASDRPVEVELADGTRIPARVDSRGQLHMDRERLPPASRGDVFSVAEPTRYVVHYRLHGRIGATTPEPAEGAMRDRGVLLGMGAWPVEVVEVKR